MKISDELIYELKRSDGASFKLKIDGKVDGKTRVEKIIEAVKKTNIKGLLDVGCGTHPSKIKDKIATGHLLCDTLIKSFPNMMLIDNNDETVNILKELDYKNIFYSDLISNKSKAMVNAYFEDEPYVVLFTDRLEHLENPIDFLKGLAKAYGNKKNKLIISVPNAYSYQRMMFMMTKGVEDNNIDHKYMFTPMTILKVLVMAGLIPEEIDFADYIDIKKNDISNIIDDNLYMAGQTIIVTCKFGV